MARFGWSTLNKQQVGRYAEYFVKMELTMLGFQVYTTEVDDRGVDFVARYHRGAFIEVQVKSLRRYESVFVEKAKFRIAPESYLALALMFREGVEPELYLIPSTVWSSPKRPFVSRDYVGKKSKPEWGINLSGKNLKALAPFEFATIASRIGGSGCA